MRHLPWTVLLAFLVGLGLGLVYAWMISPLRITDADPSSLRADFKDHYRSAIAASYAATGNLPRARARLLLLGDPDPIGALNAQAQRMLASGENLRQIEPVTSLALAMDGNTASAVPASNPATEVVSGEEVPPTATLSPPPPESSDLPTDTPFALETTSVIATSTPRPTQTPLPSPGVPFVLAGQEEICDANLPDGLLQVMVLNSSRRQMPGMKIIVAWDDGEEGFFTGLKPELGNGYADFMMTPDTSYSVQLAAGSDIAAGLTAPICQTGGGENYFGGFKLTFQQP